MIEEKIESMEAKIKELSDYLYENPEVGLAEYRSAEKISLLLEAEGFQVNRDFSEMPTAFVARKRVGEGPSIAFIAEYDALAENGHACGHHLISAMSFAAAVALASQLEEFHGEVVVVGTPSEESGDGKPYLIEKGIFENIDVAMMIHPHSKTCLAPDVLAIAGLDFNFFGKAAHAGGEPHNGINALDAIILLFNNINALRQQLKDDVRIHGIILEAGEAPNIIPAKSKARLEVRSMEQKYFLSVIEKVKDCARAAAIATGCKLEWNHYEPTCNSMNVNGSLLEILKEKMEAFHIAIEQDFLLGSTDMGNLSQVIPCIHPLLKMTEGNEGLHTVEFLEATLKPFARERVLLGAKLMALTGLELLTNPERLEKIQKEFADNKTI